MVMWSMEMVAVELVLLKLDFNAQVVQLLVRIPAQRFVEILKRWESLPVMMEIQ